MIDIVAPKRDFRRAVDRNLVRRRIRAALNEIKPGWRRTAKGKIFAQKEMLALPFLKLKSRVKSLLNL